MPSQYGTHRLCSSYHPDMKRTVRRNPLPPRPTSTPAKPRLRHATHGAAARCQTIKPIFRKRPKSEAVLCSHGPRRALCQGANAPYCKISVLFQTVRAALRRYHSVPSITGTSSLRAPSSGRRPGSTQVLRRRTEGDHDATQECKSRREIARRPMKRAVDRKFAKLANRLRDELQRHPVHAVAQARRLRSVFEDVPEVPAAAPAMNFRPRHEKLRVGRGGDGVIERLARSSASPCRC